MTTRAKSREFWSKLVREVESSGAPLSEVARRHGVHDKTLGWWRTKLRAGSGRVTLLPVRAPGETERRIRILAAQATVELAEGAEPGYVAALVRALAE